MESKLYGAAISGNVKELKMLEDNALNILQEVTPKGNTPLHLAAFHGNVKVVEMLIQMINRNIEAAKQASGGFLHQAAYHGNAKDVEMLIEMMNHDIEAGIQANVDFLRTQNKEGNTAFHEAAIGGCYKVMEALLEHDDSLVNMINRAGETPLFKAVEGGHKVIVKKLLSLTSSEYDRRTSDGQTLVQCAVCTRDKGVLKELIDAKPYLLEQTDDLGRTPLHNAAYLDGISEVAKIILETNKSLCYKKDINRQLALHIAVKEGNLDLVREILKYAKDSTEVTDSVGRNALHLAIENAVHIFDKISSRIKDLVLFVISKRLINKADKKGKTALDIAMDNMHSDERLFSGIKWFLEINGARRNPMVTREHSLTIEKSTWNVQIISVNAVLIATVAFAAAFTLPKENKNDKISDAFFQLTVICVELAFCSSISSAVLLMYSTYGKQEDSRLLNISLGGLWIALISLLLAFGAGIYVAVVQDHEPVALSALAMVSNVPVLIRILILHSKKYIFRDDEYYLWVLLIATVVKTSVWISYIYLELVMVVMLIVTLRRRYLQSKEKISRGDGNYIWFITWYMILSLIYVLPSQRPLIWLIIYLVCITMGIGAFTARKLYSRSKQKPSTDDYDYLWVFTGGSIIGLTMNVLFIELLDITYF